MADRKRTKGGQQKRTATAKNARQNKQGNEKNEVLAVVLFAMAILLLFIAFIKGQSVWLFLHNTVFGIFGICSYILPFIILFIAVNFARGESKSGVAMKITQSVTFTALLGACCHLVSKKIESKDFFDFISIAFTKGTEIKNGGVFGALIGEALWLAVGRACAIIIIIILLFVFYMLVSSTSILSIFELFKDMVKKRQERRIMQMEDDYHEETLPKENRKQNSDYSKVPISEGSVTFDYEKEDILGDNCDFQMITEMPDHPVNSEYDMSPKENETPRKKSLFSKKERAEEKPVPKVKAKENATAPFIEIEENGYRFPPITLLDLPSNESVSKVSSNQLHATAEKLVETLRSFNVETQITNISRGPSVTRFELKPAPGVKISKITSLSDDIALNLAANGVRIEAPIPGKSAVGIEVPNPQTSIVSLREIIDSDAFFESKSKLSVALGKDIAGNIAVADMAKMPHTLIAGATGSGKSVCINAIILSLLYKSSPGDVRLLMIDPKVVELGVYNGIPHLLVPVVTDPRKAAGALGWAVTEMLNRYKLFSENSVKDLSGYNMLASKTDGMTTLPQIVIIIDELADLMMVAPNEVEDSIMRLAQMARAAGMHLIIATQRPSVDVITGTIKTNIPSRIAFAVSSGVDSRIILDSYGAEKLIGKGDMLYSPVGVSKPSRIQGCFVSTKEIDAVLSFIKNTQDTEYDESVMEEIEKQTVNEGEKKKKNATSGGEEMDDMLKKAIEVAVINGNISTSFLQRKLSLGYARAARLIDEMEERGIVGPPNGSKPREVLITRNQLMEMENAGSDLLE